MIAGLLFAIAEAEDRPGALTATLPLGGVTLIEYQARLLVAAGAAQIVVLVARLTPELVGAVARIARRGVSVDTVRTPAEAAAKLHPLARLVVLADGLVTAEGALDQVAGEGRDALLVVPEDAASRDFERVGGGMRWAGVARLAPRRLEEVAALPADYDPQSALLRVAAQAGAASVELLPEARTGHGIERRGAALEAHGRAVLAASVAGRRPWFDRWIVAPLAKLALPPLMDRGVPTIAPAAAAGVAAAAGLALLGYGSVAAGALLALAGVVAAMVAVPLAWLRDEEALARGLAVGTVAVPALALLLLGRAADLADGGYSAEVIALAAVAAGALAERAALPPRRRWWATPPALLLVAAAAALVGVPTAGLTAAALYAGASLAEAIERLRRLA